jgi:glycine C-acetyltransferase
VRAVSAELTGRGEVRDETPDGFVHADGAVEIGLPAAASRYSRVAGEMDARRRQGLTAMALCWTVMGNPLSYLHDQLEQWRAEGTYQRLRVLQSEAAAESCFDGKEVINLASNNYLGLTTHPRLREAALRAVERFGVGSGAVRTISGTMSLHMQLEERIAAFKNVEACVVFQSGFAANAGTVSAILTPEDHIISDELNHASIIDGCRLSKAKIHVFPHKDVAAAERILGELDGAPGRKLLISDGVFSMDGDIGPLPGLVEAAERHGAIMMVDDAHSSGVLGRNGRGTIDHFGLHGRVHVQVGTLSKAIGVLGGYVCGSRDLIEFLYHRARPFLFSTSHPPAVAAACLAAFDVLEQEPERIERLWANTRYFKQGLTAAGFDTGISETPITPVIVGEAAAAHQLSRELFQEGVLATGIGFPTVPKGKARVRTIVTSEHTRAELDRALEVFRKVGKKMGLVS